MSDRLSEIVESAEAERLATGFVFTEGPLWHPDGYLLFVDIRRAQIFKLVPGEEPELIRGDSGDSNGMTFDSQGRRGDMRDGEPASDANGGGRVVHGHRGQLGGEAAEPPERCGAQVGRQPVLHEPGARPT